MSSLKICLCAAAALTVTFLFATPAALARDGGTDRESSQGNGRVTFTTPDTFHQNLSKTSEPVNFRGFINQLKTHEVKREEMRLLAEYSALRAKAIQAGPNSPLFKTLTAMEMQIAAKFRALGGAPELLGPLS